MKISAKQALEDYIQTHTRQNKALKKLHDIGTHRLDEGKVFVHYRSSNNTDIYYSIFMLTLNGADIAASLSLYVAQEGRLICMDEHCDKNLEGIYGEVISKELFMEEVNNLKIF